MTYSKIIKREWSLCAKKQRIFFSLFFLTWWNYVSYILEMHYLFRHYAAFLSNYRNIHFLGAKSNRDNNNFNPSCSLVLIIPEAAWGVYAPTNLELYIWYEAESYTIDTTWKKVLINETCPMCILQIWKPFSWSQQNLKMYVNVLLLSRKLTDESFKMVSSLDPKIWYGLYFSLFKCCGRPRKLTGCACSEVPRGSILVSKCL